MNDEPDLEIALRAKTFIEQGPGGGTNVLNAFDEVAELIDAATDDDDWIEFQTFGWVGDPADLKVEPGRLLLRRAAISGFREVTKAMWEDRMRDMKHDAMTRGGLAMMPVPGPPAGR